MKMTKNSSYKALCCIIFIGVMILFNLVFVVAGDLTAVDSIKSYDTKTQTVLLINSANLSKNIASIKLDTPLHYEVPLGYQKVAEFQISTYEDYLNAFEKMEFYDMDENMKPVERVFDYKVQVNNSYIVNDYKVECEEKKANFINGTQQQSLCSNVLIGNHTEYRNEWIPIEKTDFLKGDTKTISIWTEVFNGDDIEWITTFYGSRLTEWASYSATGGTITTILDGGKNYTIHTFTTSGTFTITGTINLSEILIVGGGGSGGGAFQNLAGGGGAGGVVYARYLEMSDGEYAVVVGAGGASTAECDANCESNGFNGTSSSFGGLIALGGGAGGGGSTTSGDGKDGGSGGGEGYDGNKGLGTQGNGTNYTGWGQDGGAGDGSAGGGGGGAEQDGVLLNGGAGKYYSIRNGTAMCYAGGGAGGDDDAAGGVAGCYGGDGGDNGAANGGNGVNGTGAGGGGAGYRGSIGHTNSGGMGGSGIVIIRYLTDTSTNPSVQLNSPANYFNTSNPAITFNITAVDLNDGGAITNVTLYIDGIANDTDTSGFNGTYLFNKTLSEGLHNWSILAWSNLSKTNQTETRFLTIDTIAPLLNIVAPTNSTYYTSFSLTNNASNSFKWVASDSLLSKCWYSVNNGATNTTITCNANATIYDVFNKTITYIAWANDTTGNLNTSRISATNRTYTLLNSVTYTSNLFETETTSYILNISEDNFDITTKGGAEVYLNGTRKAMTRTTDANSYEIWNFTYGHPADLIGNLSIVFNGSLGNTTIYYQLANKTYFILCDLFASASERLQNTTTEFNISYYTLNFKDEANLSSIKARLPLATFNYSLGDGSSSKLLTYSNITDNVNYTFCYNPSTRNVNVDAYIQYSGGAYAQRTYNPVLALFTNASQTKTLYLLGSGQWVTFQVLNQAEQPIPDVYVNASRTIDGTTTVVGEGTTDASGGIQFYLNPDFSHTFFFIGTGYNVYTTSFAPTQTSYTVSLSSSSSTSVDYTTQITIKITPTNSTLFNDTIYNFSSKLTSGYWEIDKFGFTIKNGTGFTYYTTSATTNGGYLSTLLNTFDNQSLQMEFYYLTNGTYTNYTYNWMVWSSDGTDWSIKHFGDDLKAYLATGMFGMSLGSFGLGIIMFLIILVSVGIMSYKFGFNSAPTIMGALFAVVFLLDVGLGLLDSLNPINAIPHFPTIFVAIIVIGMIIRENLR